MLETPEVFGERIHKQLQEIRDQKATVELRRIEEEKRAAAEPQAVKDQKRAEKVLAELETVILKAAALWDVKSFHRKHIHVMELTHGDCSHKSPYQPSTGELLPAGNLIGAGFIVFEFCALADLHPYVMYVQKDETDWHGTGFSIYICPLPAE